MQSEIRTTKHPILNPEMNNYLHFTDRSTNRLDDEAILRAVVSTNAPYIQCSNKTLNKDRCLKKGNF